LQKAEDGSLYLGDLRQEVRQQLGDAFYREAGHQVDKHQHPHQQREGRRQQKQRGGPGVDRHVQRQVAAQYGGGDLYPTGRFLFHGGSLWGDVYGGVVAGQAVFIRGRVRLRQSSRVYDEHRPPHYSINAPRAQPLPRRRASRPAQSAVIWRELGGQ